MVGNSPSRSCLAEDLIKSKLWWHGPPFLQGTEDQWPDMPTTFDEDIANKELVIHPPAITFALVSSSDSHSCVAKLDDLITVSRYGCKAKLLRVTALVMKVARSFKRGKGEQGRSVQLELTARDIQEAEELWVKSIQRQVFSKEYQSLAQNKKDVSLNQLNLFLDDIGIIRCKGRLGRASVSSYENHPILMTPKHWFSTLIIRCHHNRSHHSGIRDTLNSVRGMYWIIRGREAVKKVIRKCIVCLRAEGKPYPTPHMPDLPEERVNDGPPFINTGVDFAGPLYVWKERQVGKQVKAYICLFTCAATRAVTFDLSAEMFLLAFRRFTSRRGTPNLMISDNAKVFKAASAVIKKVVQAPEVKRYLLNNQITWDFIVEKAPRWGGFWERLVGSVKRCLKKTIGRSTLTFEEMRTLLVEIESTLNNRPLTYVYDDAEGISQPLTPANLIYGRQIVGTANGRHFEIISTAQSLTKRARYQARLLTQFVKCWRREYLLGLRENSQRQKKNQRVTPTIQLGDIVILKDDLTLRAWWKLARVIELLSGRDNQVRAARAEP